jgi:diamine N-acetyltransferase
MLHSIKIDIVDESSIPVIQSIAEATWRPTYGNILTEEQTLFMLEMMYSEEVLKSQFAKCIFQILYFNEKAVGFSCIEFINSGYSKLHKIYFLPETQGRGLGKVMIDAVANKAKELGSKSLILNVNRKNKAQLFYEKLGFEIIGEEDIDIGNGYWMNDFIMRKNL